MAKKVTKVPKRAPGGGRKARDPLGKHEVLLQVRIPRVMLERLNHEAVSNAVDRSEEVRARLKQSFDLPAELQKRWGSPHIAALARLVSQVVQQIERAVREKPFDEAEDLAWNTNVWVHGAVCAAIAAILARLKPDGTSDVPEAVRQSVERMRGHISADMATQQLTPEGLGISCALGVISQIEAHRGRPSNSAILAGGHYGDAYYLYPKLRRDLGEKS